VRAQNAQLGLLIGLNFRRDIHLDPYNNRVVEKNVKARPVAWL
jgi:hypothetical protein